MDKQYNKDGVISLRRRIKVGRRKHTDMVTSSVNRLASCFLLLLALLHEYDAQFLTTTSSTTTRKPNSFNCGRSMFSDPSGNITSPNYPNNYGNMQFCNYFVVAPSLSTINFTLNALGLEQDDYCNFDWIEFTCQSNSISRTIRYCGRSNDSELSFKPCTRVLIRFVSDGSGTDVGFFVSYDIEPISCQGNCTPVAIGAGYNCTCDANQTDPFVAPPYNQCPDSCHLSDSSPNSYTFCACNNVPATSITTHPPPTVPACADGCYPYIDTYGYPVCYCNVTVTSTTPTTTKPLECPYGCYIGQDSYGYPICRCEGTTKSTPCPFGCYNVTYYYGYSYCECSTPQPTTPLTITCPSGCFPDKDFWGTPYCRCNSSYSTTTTYPPYNSSSPSCNYPCYYTYNNTGTRYCFCGSSTTVEPCYYPCRYEYDFYGHQYCSCNTTSTTTPVPTLSPGCNFTYNDTYGTLMSPNYPNRYPSNINCLHVVTIPMANSIQITFVDLSVYYSSSDYCLYEWVEVTGCNGSIKEYCGSSWVNREIQFVCTESYTVTVLFHSYYYQSVGYRGFKLNYRSSFASSCNSIGGSVYLGSSGTIMSPNYPDSYPLSNDCYYLLQAADGQRIRIRIVFGQLSMQYSPGCSLDFIKLSCLDGSGSPWFLCGTRIPNPVTFNCSSVEIQFHSETLPGSGLNPRLFRLLYYGVEGVPPTTLNVTSAASLPNRLGLTGAEGGLGNIRLLPLIAMAVMTIGSRTLSK